MSKLTPFQAVTTAHIYAQHVYIASQMYHRGKVNVIN